MNLKRIFGAILTIAGVAGLIYGAYMFIQDSGAIKEMAVGGGLGLIFFFAGLSLVKATSDEAKA